MDYYEAYKEKERECDRLKYKLEDLRNQLRDAERETRKANERADNAEFRIRQELEPRIKREERAYDSFVTRPRTDGEEM